MEIKMNMKVSDLTIEQLKILISETVRETMKDFVEDFESISSKKYTDSIKESREEYKAGDTKDFDEVFDV